MLPLLDRQNAIIAMKNQVTCHLLCLSLWSSVDAKIVKGKSLHARLPSFFPDNNSVSTRDSTVRTPLRVYEPNVIEHNPFAADGFVSTRASDDDLIGLDDSFSRDSDEKNNDRSKSSKKRTSSTDDDTKVSKKGKRDKRGKKDSKASSICSFEPSGSIRATPANVVTKKAATRGAGDFTFEFTDGFRRMEYDLTIFDQPVVDSVDLYCASEGSEAEIPVVSLEFRDGERTYASHVNNADVAETECAEDGTVINNVGK